MRASDTVYTTITPYSVEKYEPQIMGEETIYSLCEGGIPIQDFYDEAAAIAACREIAREALDV